MTTHEGGVVVVLVVVTNVEATGTNGVSTHEHKRHQQRSGGGGLQPRTRRTSILASIITGKYSANQYHPLFFCACFFHWFFFLTPCPWTAPKREARFPLDRVRSPLPPSTSKERNQTKAGHILLLPVSCAFYFFNHSSQAEDATLFDSWLYSPPTGPNIHTEKTARGPCHVAAPPIH